MRSIKLICVLLASLLAEAQSSSIQPNILLVYIDDLGWRDVGYQGSRFYETPHVDALAASGLVFTSAYSNGPNCAPSRACLMTGLYTPRHSIYTVGSSARGQSSRRRLIPTPNETVLHSDFVTIAEVLKGAGYRTGHFGKWHLGPDPKEQGFDKNVGGNKTGSPRGGHFSPYKNPNLSNGPDGEYLTRRLTDEAITFMDASQKAPFFCYLTHYAVHAPIQAPKALIQKYKAKRSSDKQKNPRYAAMIEEMDKSVGKVVAHVGTIKRPTVIIYMSDNGGLGGVTDMSPLRGAKGMLYEGGVRVPLIIRWEGQTKSQTQCTAPVMGIDLYPTLCDVAGVKADRPEKLDGVSLVPFLNPSSDRRLLHDRSVFWHFPAYLQGNRRSKDPFRTRPAGAIRRGDWKLLQFFEDNRIELYNLSRDIGEQKNVITGNPEKTKELLDALRAWQVQVNAPIPTKRNPEYRPATKPGKPKRVRRSTP